MMETNRIYFIIAVVVSLLASSFVAKNGSQANSDYLVFGLFYGECEGSECVQVYRLDNNSLYKDKNSHYPSFYSFYSGRFEKLSDKKYKQVCSITAEIPQELIKRKSGIIGQPDEGDWGGLYIEYSDKGEKKFWIIDKNKTNLPKYLHPFVDDVEEAIKLLNK
ncbi:hypothetical protein ACFS7Z_20745 [Pontibacter toksunensis]|uniref:Uncharacterized protein n=1 Tax=Pontibacter toksunensis TaxID=1332631 RepID=A0ABW6C2B8_9BACT